MGLCNSKIKGRRIKRSTTNDLSNDHGDDVENHVYSFPHDDEECDRIHLQHLIERYIWQGNFFSPIENLLNQAGTKVLDVGTGSGAWLLEMATKYSKSEFIGIDISQMQPDENIPPNAKFIQANVLERLPFNDNTFDFIFQRILFAGIPRNKWSSTIDELVRVLKPGGYLELAENDFQYNMMGLATRKIVDGLLILFHERGIDPTVCYKLQNYLEENKQLHNVHCEEKKYVDGQYSTKVYKLLFDDYSAVLTNIKPTLMNIIKVSSEEYDGLVNDMGKEVMESECFNMHVRVYAQKKA
ncbi:7869_t:CDS:2 [Scutellospora calospora]|uniref:7869_t:CDS:1 n=1 Tax=Scutellospora calospora TaxID=85575 RepID=A0ACA9KXF6_9GLOM|nr:7869_t:CDS:2 [Scutellospora calospora]